MAKMEHTWAIEYTERPIQQIPMPKLREYLKERKAQLENSTSTGLLELERIESFLDGFSANSKNG